MNEAFTRATSLMATFLSLLDKPEPFLPIALWHMDTKGNITFLKEKVPPLTNMDMGLLLRDPGYALGMMEAPDHEIFQEAMRRLHERHPVAVLFGVVFPGNESHRFALFGTPESDGPGYWGLFVDYTAIFRPERRRFSSRLTAPRDAPLLTMSLGDFHIRHFNPAARALLDLDNGNEHFFEAYCPLFSEEWDIIREALLFDGVWEGSLTIRGAHGAVTCGASVHPLPHERLLEVCLHPVPFAQEQGFFHQLAAALEKPRNESELLKTVLEHRPQSIHTEGILLSRIFQKENRIVVSAVGPLFGEGLPPTEYSYTGSIADDIVREGLAYLIEEETVRSTRPVDWVIYVPRGISSYCAVPFFTGTRLDLVLVFCSGRPRAFVESDIPTCRETLRLMAAHVERVDAID